MTSWQIPTKILHSLPPEVSHTFTLRALQLAKICGLSSYFALQVHKPKTCMGLSFMNPIGVAAGLDKNADYVDALGSLGFGFIEVGTVTLRPQEGKKKPRLFRLQNHKALINRMGFNNKGCEYVIRQLEKRTYKGIVGVNLGINADTPLEKAPHEYAHILRRMYAVADYLVLNVSSPNTLGLRSLQHKDSLNHILESACNSLIMQEKGNTKVPLLLKISPDLERDDLFILLQQLAQYPIAGIIATNTTISREQVELHRFASEQGGLSGEPLLSRANEITQFIALHKSPHLALIASGGLVDEKAIMQKFALGADLVQLYTGLVYRPFDFLPKLSKVIV